MKKDVWWFGGNYTVLFKRLFVVGYNLKRLCLGIEYHHGGSGLSVYIGPFWFNIRSTEFIK